MMTMPMVDIAAIQASYRGEGRVLQDVLQHGDGVVGAQVGGALLGQEVADVAVEDQRHLSPLGALL